MKKLTVILIVLPLLLMGKSYAQEKGQLIRYDEDAFEKVVKATDEYKANTFLLSWAKQVFSSYCGEKKAKVNFSEQEYNDKLEELRRLNNANNTLQENLTKAETNLENKQVEVDTAAARLQRLQNENKNLKKQLSDLSGADKQIQAKDKSIEQLVGQIDVLNAELTEKQNQINARDAQIQKLEADIVSKGEEMESLQNQLATVNAENATLTSQLQAKDAQITERDNKNTELQNANDALAASNAEYEEVFKSTKETIDRIYTDNMKKSIVDMNPSDLEKAWNTYEGMKTLLAVNPTLSKDLEAKVKEMNTWKALIEPMRGAKQYLKGKYDDKERQQWIKELKNVNVTGSKADEKQLALKLLEDEATLHHYYELFLGFLVSKGCLPTAEKFQEAQDRFAQMKTYSQFVYHPSTYDSYDRAVQMIEAELNQAGPGKNVKTAPAFESFIARLKEVY